MNVAVLFNSDHQSLSGYYGPPIKRAILGTGVLQASSRMMRVSLGDVLTYSAVTQSKDRSIRHLTELCTSLYKPTDLDLLRYKELASTFTTATVYCWVFQNMTSQQATSMHSKLLSFGPYLGAMDVLFSNPLHLALFRNSLIEKYRFQARKCSVFYGMGENEDPDVVERDLLEEGGFQVIYEDMGARRTIFDNYDTLEHFTRVGDFERVFATIDGVSKDDACDLSLCLEEIHPKLFDAFAAAARAIDRAETEEDLAQAALSGRRLLEKTADYLRPPSNTPWKGRRVGNAEYKNRLWAYLEETIESTPGADPNLLDDLGREADRLVVLFNTGLHSDLTRKRIEEALRDLVRWLSRVVEINFELARRPYLAYEQELTAFISEVLRPSGESALESSQIDSEGNPD